MMIEAPFCTFDKEKFPSKSVITPFVVPSTMTDAPMMGSPMTSFTVPLQDEAC